MEVRSFLFTDSKRLTYSVRMERCEICGRTSAFLATLHFTYKLTNETIEYFYSFKYHFFIEKYLSIFLVHNLLAQLNSIDFAQM